MSGVPGVVSCDQLQWVRKGGMVSHGEGVCAARGSVKYHLPRCSEVDGSGGWEFTESVGDEVRGDFVDENGCNSLAK